MRHYNEFRYQHRGYGKYADIVRLFGWATFTGYYHKVGAVHLQRTVPGLAPVAPALCFSAQDYFAQKLLL